jgi:hypothetical protein
MSHNTIKIGSLVEVSAYGGETLRRRVVEIRDETVYICRNDEWDIAKRERRDPQTVGFNRRFVLRVLETASE